MAKLELALLVGQESKDWLLLMEALVTRLEAALPHTLDTTTEPTTASTTPRKNGKAKPVKQDDEEQFSLGDDTDDNTTDGNEEEPTREVTLKELITVCLKNKETALKILKKLKVDNVNKLNATQRATMLSQLEARQ